MKFFLLINVKKGILTFMSRKNSISGLSELAKSLVSSDEHEKFFITSDQFCASCTILRVKKKQWKVSVDPDEVAHYELPCLDLCC